MSFKIKINAAGETEVTRNNKFVASWRHTDLSDRDRAIVESMLITVFQGGLAEGRRLLQGDLRDLLGVRQ